MLSSPTLLQTAAHRQSAEAVRQCMLVDVLMGLSSTPRQLPCKYLYDARGSELFEQICATPEYYPTRTEMQILEQSGADIMDFLGPLGGDLIELGSGSNQKIRTLLSTIGRQHRRRIRYVPVDISESCLIQATRELSDLHAEVQISGIVADFTGSLAMLAGHRRKLILFLGSTIGNFSTAECSAFLQKIAGVMNPADFLVLGLDMLKPIPILEAAYNDAAGITAAFNLNILHHLNRDLGTDFDLRRFQHRAVFNAPEARIEMHLRVLCDMTVSFAGSRRRIHFRKDDAIRTEICRKFTRHSAAALFRAQGLLPIRWFTDERRWFSVVVLHKKP